MEDRTERPVSDATEEVLLFASDEQRATIEQWLNDCRALTDDPHVYETGSASGNGGGAASPRRFRWWTNSHLPDGSITGGVVEINDRGGPCGNRSYWKLPKNGRVVRGTLWLRQHGTRRTPAPSAPDHPWPLPNGPRIAVVVLGAIPMTDLPALTSRVQMFFGSSAEVVADTELASELKVGMAFQARQAS